MTTTKITAVDVTPAGTVEVATVGPRGITAAWEASDLAAAAAAERLGAAVTMLDVVVPEVRARSVARTYTFRAAWPLRPAVPPA